MSEKPTNVDWQDVLTAPDGAWAVEDADDFETACEEESGSSHSDDHQAESCDKDTQREVSASRSVGSTGTFVDHGPQAEGNPPAFSVLRLELLRREESSPPLAGPRHVTSQRERDGFPPFTEQGHGGSDGAAVAVPPPHHLAGQSEERDVLERSDNDTSDDDMGGSSFMPGTGPGGLFGRGGPDSFGPGGFGGDSAY